MHLQTGSRTSASCTAPYAIRSLPRARVTERLNQVANTQREPRVRGAETGSSSDFHGSPARRKPAGRHTCERRDYDAGRDRAERAGQGFSPQAALPGQRPPRSHSRTDGAEVTRPASRSIEARDPWLRGASGLRASMRQLSHMSPPASTGGRRKDAGAAERRSTTADRAFFVGLANRLPIGLVRLEVLAGDELPVGSVGVDRGQAESAYTVHTSTVEEEDLLSVGRPDRVD